MLISETANLDPDAQKAKSQGTKPRSPSSSIKLRRRLSSTSKSKTSKGTPQFSESEIISMFRGEAAIPDYPKKKIKGAPEKGGTWKRLGRQKKFRDDQVTTGDKRQKQLGAELSGFSKATSKLTLGESRQFLNWRKPLHDLWRRMLSPTSDGCRSECFTSGAADLDELLQLSSVDEMRELWRAKPRPMRRARWPPMMLAALYLAPERAAEVLVATLGREQRMQMYAVPDVLAFLCRWSSRLPVPQRAAQQASLPGLLVRLLRGSQPRDYQFQQWVLYDIIQLCNLPELVELYQELQRYCHPLSVDTKLHIADRFAKDVHHKEQAFEILNDMVMANQLDINSTHGAALATAIMTFPKPDKAGDDKDAQRATLPQIQADFYERLLRIGVVPNKIHYTAMIRNLCHTKQLVAAWDVYRIMRDQGITPDPHVYATLLHGSKVAGDVGSTKQALAEGSRELAGETYMWNDLLDTILKASMQERRRTNGLGPMRAFRAMVRIYLKFFKPEPLQKLLRSDLRAHFAAAGPTNESPNWQWAQEMSDLLEMLPQSPPETLVEPGNVTLTIMLIGYLRSADNLNTLLAFYWNFRGLFKSGDPTVAKLLEENTVIYDTILKTILQHQGTVRTSLNITSDMLTDAAAYSNAIAAAEATAAEADPTPFQPPPATPRFHPAPSVFTWSILLYGLVHENAVRYGRRVLALMREHSIEPNQVTWNSLIKGYALDQNPLQTARALFDMERAGYLPNERTHHAFSHLAPQEKALQLLERWNAEADAEVEEAAEQQEQQEEQQEGEEAEPRQALKEENKPTPSKTTSIFAERIKLKRALAAQEAQEQEEAWHEHQLLLQEEDEYRYDEDEEDGPWTDAPAPTPSSQRASKEDFYAQKFLQMRDVVEEVAEDMRRDPEVGKKMRKKPQKGTKPKPDVDAEEPEMMDYMSVLEEWGKEGQEDEEKSKAASG